MPTNKKRHSRGGVLGQLRAAEASQVLWLLLERHPDLEPEARALAEGLISAIDVEALASDVTDAVGEVDYSRMNSRAGRQPWGYVEPTQAAWDVLGEAVLPFTDDLKRLLELGPEAAAAATCKGIVLGLYSLRDTKSDGVLGWAPDFPLEVAAQAVSDFVSSARTESLRGDVVSDLCDEAVDWADTLERVAGNDES